MNAFDEWLLMQLDAWSCPLIATAQSYLVH